MPPWILALFWILPALFGRGGWLWFTLAVLLAVVGYFTCIMAFEPRGELVSNERFIGLGITVVIYLFLAFMYSRRPGSSEAS